MIKKIFLSTLVCGSFANAHTLYELVDLSLNNKQVQSARSNIKSIEKEYESYQNSNLPNISVGAKYTMADVESAAFAKSSALGYARATYVIYDGSMRDHIYDSYESGIKSSNLELEQLKNKIALSVINYYYNFQTLRSFKETKQKEIETLQAQQERLQNFLNVGKTTSDEVDKIISNVESANVALQEIELQMQTILHALEYITAQKITLDKHIYQFDIKGIKNTQRADIEAMKHKAQQVLNSAKALKSADYPIISIDDTFNHYENSYENKLYDSGIDNQNIISLNLSWNLYDFGSNEQKYQAGYKQYLAQKDQLDYETYKAEVDLQLALKAYEISKSKIDSAKANLKAANSAFDTIEAKYQNGSVDNVAYLDALREKFTAYSGYQKSLNDLEIQKANIIYFSGNNLQEYIK